MKTRLIKIGNSRGLRIPKPIIEQTGLTDEVELEVKDNRIIVSPATRPREKWEESFRAMAERGDDELLDDLTGHSRWDRDEWHW